MQTKLEINPFETKTLISIRTLAEQLVDDIKIARKNNNSQNNCAHLTRYLLQLLDHYVYSEEKPTQKPSTSSSRSMINTVVNIKNVNGIDVVWDAFALRASPSLSLQQIDTENYTNNEQIPKTPVELDQDDLNAILRKEAQKIGDIVYGEIGLASVKVNKAGHQFVFLADEREVIYIDAQLYDGIKKEGNPLFTDIRKKFYFRGDQAPGNNQFSTRCFYLPCVVTQKRYPQDSSLYRQTPPTMSFSDKADSNMLLTIDTKESLCSFSSTHLKIQSTLKKGIDSSESHLQTPSPLTLNSFVIVEEKRSDTTAEKNDFRKNVQFVDAQTGRPTQFTGELLQAAIKEKAVILRTTYRARQLVDAETGILTQLEGDELKAAVEAKTVIFKCTYQKRKLVDATTGKVTQLTGEALKEAQEQGLVMTSSMYLQRKSVDAKTGKTTDLKGDELKKAKEEGRVISRTRYTSRNQTKSKRVLNDSTSKCSKKTRFIRVPQDDVFTSALVSSGFFGNETEQAVETTLFITSPHN